MIAKVIQFMRPNGRQVEKELTIKDDCIENYKTILAYGARLTAEQMMSGMVSQTIETVVGDFDVILSKGTDLAENKMKLEEMILRFDKTAFLKWEEGILQEE